MPRNGDDMVRYQQKLNLKYKTLKIWKTKTK